MSRRHLAVTVLAAMAITGGASAVAAQTAEPATVTAYINPDTGKASANPDVDPASSCETPDQQDQQATGAFADKSNNVHVDACLADDAGAALDQQVAYDVTGVGGVTACPDPDADGPKTATASDTNADGINDRCVLSGYEAANNEYHVRVLSESAGTQTVTFCADPEADGCSNATATSVVSVTYVEVNTPQPYVNRDSGKPSENTDVAADSSCATPDRQDSQATGSFSDKSNNVHVDGCLVDAAGANVDTQVTFEVAGVGGVTACPDPDADGPKTATASDTNADGRNDRCVLSGYEAANTEYHVRVLSETAGTQTITMCEDPEGDGCANAAATSVVDVTYVATLPVTGSNGLLPVAALVMVAGGIALIRRPQPSL